MFPLNLSEEVPVNMDMITVCSSKTITIKSLTFIFITDTVKYLQST